jgi:hypothetical protein
MDTKTLQDLKSLITDTITDITISNPEKTETLTKITIRQMQLKGKVQYQIEEFTKTQAFHKNVILEELKKLFPAYFENRFRQAQLHLQGEDVQILVSKKGAVSILRKKAKTEA